MELVSVRRPSGQRRRRPEALSGDKGYSYPRVRQWLREHGIRAIIPLREDQRAKQHRTDQAFDRTAYKERNVVERCVGWLKECRRILTRFEKLAVNYLATTSVRYTILRIGQLMMSPGLICGPGMGSLLVGGSSGSVPLKVGE